MTNEMPLLPDVIDAIEPVDPDILYGEIESLWPEHAEELLEQLLTGREAME